MKNVAWLQKNNSFIALYMKIGEKDCTALCNYYFFGYLSFSKLQEQTQPS